MTQLMGILNCTPDSFYDGAEMTVDERVGKGLCLIADGAQILDIGGESTRPDATPIDCATETARVIPVIRQIRAVSSALISIDTYRSETAEAALLAGANIINDIRGGEFDRSFSNDDKDAEKMFVVAKKFSAPLILMHCQGDPATMQRAPAYTDVVSEVITYLQQRLIAARNYGLTEIIVDPGFGFGKTTEHNWALFAALPKICEIFHRQKTRVLIGVSNKRMLGGMVAERQHQSIAAAVQAARAGVDIIRVHHVAETHAALCSALPDFAPQSTDQRRVAKSESPADYANLC